MTDTSTAALGSRAAKPQQILDAARDLFLRDGFGATSMDAVAKTAGVSKATVYAHFSSKEELFAEMMSAECRRYWPELLDRERAPADPVGKLREIGRRYIHFINGSYSVSLLRIVASEAARLPELGRIFYEMGPNRGRARFIELLSRIDRTGALTIPDPVQATDRFFSMLRGDAHLRCLIGMEAPLATQLDAYADEAVAAFLKLYAPTPASS